MLEILPTVLNAFPESVFRKTLILKTAMIDGGEPYVLLWNTEQKGE